MATEKIVIRGARQHNLKNIDLTIPRDKLVVITGLSGSGKSTLAFDTIYAEGQRRYVESLSAYARQFLGQMNKPDVDTIDGLSPAISIEQKTVSKNPRSTVGTVTEIYDYFRLLYARIGKPNCYNCGRPIESQTVTQMVDRILSRPERTRVHILAPVIRGRKGEYLKEFKEWAKAGYVRARVDGEIRELASMERLDKKYKHDIDVFVDRLVVKDGIRGRLTDSVETALKLAEGLMKLEVVDGDGNPVETELFSEKFACDNCGISYPDLEPRMFSFNNPHGACAECDGLGSMLHVDPDLVVPDKTLSINEGAIAPWAGKQSRYITNTLKALTDHYDIDLDKPWKKLPKKLRTILLEGSGEEDVRFFYSRGRRKYYYHRPWEGLTARLERFYEESSSDRMREQIERYMNPLACSECGGARLRIEARHVYVGGLPVHEVTAMSIRDASEFFSELELDERDAEIGQRILKEIDERLGFLLNIGLDYLTLDRASGTLSGGEGQRIRLATQVSSSLVGVLYILDEPSIGLHQRDNQRLLETLRQMRDLGNTVVVVEHDEDTIRAADWVIDLGPGAGVLGGNVVFSGPPEELLENRESLTADYMTGRRAIEIPERREPNDRLLTVRGAKAHNLKNIDVTFPLGCFVAVTGVSGSGKSTLVIDTLYRAMAQRLYKSRGVAGEHESIDGMKHIDKVIDIDQSPIGRTPRSNPATYTGVFTFIRDLFAQLPEARARGYQKGRFSFNVKGGRCEACTGDGLVKIEMHFLPDIYVKCDQCQGRRYNRQTLEVKYKGKNIHEVLEMTVREAYSFFENIPALHSRLGILNDVGLSYIKLGQPATTLSGGEAQRIKLARELSKRETSRTLYILDEPTTGLHFADVHKLLEVLHRLTSTGNTVIVIEHNLEVIKVADWVIDLGPEGGDHGGRVVAEGSPESVAANPASYTGQFLRGALERARERAEAEAAASSESSRVA